MTETRQTSRKKTSDLTFIRNILSDHKAEDIRIYNVKKLTTLFDYIIICTSSSTTHSQALYKEVRKQLKTRDQVPYSETGVMEGHWLALDYLDYVIHIFDSNTRSYYALENIWGDAPLVEE